MKIRGLVLLLVSFNSLASNPCGGSSVGFWTNPDGSRGGWIGKDAKVQTGVTIAPGAEVCEFAQVKSGAQILGQAHIGGRAQILMGAVIEGRAKVQGEAKVGGSEVTTKVGGDATIEGSSTITGSSQVFARARVGGGSRVHNSIVCQASVIEGISVENSDYYCQTEDPEPPHPGEAGKKTLLGIDSDRDGVRDDLEIWINDTFSNTPNKDNYNYRMVLKQFAGTTNKLLRDRKSKEKVRNNSELLFDAIYCARSLSGKAKNADDEIDNLDRVHEIVSQLQTQIYNTLDRIKEHQKTEAHLHGKSLGGTGGKEVCAFKVKK